MSGQLPRGFPPEFYLLVLSLMLVVAVGAIVIFFLLFLKVMT